MRLDDAAGALAVGDHDDGVRVGAGELGAHGHRERAAEPVGHVEHEPVLGGLDVVDVEVAERVGVQPRAVPRVEAVGHVSRGSHVAARPRPRRRGTPRAAVVRRAPAFRSAHDAVLDRAQAHPREDPVVERGIRHPVAGAGVYGRAASRASDRARCRRRRRSPPGARAEVGHCPGPASRVPSPSRQRTTSRPATVRSSVRPVGTSADAAATSQPWVGRRSAAAGGVVARRLGVAPGAAQVVESGLGEVAHRHAVAHLLTPGPVGAQQAHPATLTPGAPAGQRRPVVRVRDRPIGPAGTPVARPWSDRNWSMWGHWCEVHIPFLASSLSSLSSLASGSLRLSATGPLDPQAVWDRYTRPVWWPVWAPHLRRVDYPDAVVTPGTTGRVTGVGGVVAVFGSTRSTTRRGPGRGACSGPLRLRLERTEVDRRARLGAPSGQHHVARDARAVAGG